MAKKRIADLEKAISQTEASIKKYQKEEEQRELNFLMLTKASEVLIEACWKFFKLKVEDEGLSAPSPKEAVRKAATIGLIDNPVKWLEFIDARNLSVHDYYGLSDEDFLRMAIELVKCARNVKNN